MDDKTIRNIINNPQGTHNQVAVNSIAMAVLKLKDDFLEDSTDPEGDLNEAYQDCIKTLKALTVDDFFKAGEERDPALVAEIERDLPGVIEYIIAQTKRPLDTNFDIVTLYLGDKEEILELHLKWVLPLLLWAFQKDSAFTDGYKEIPIESSRLIQAQADRPLRMFSFFRCLQRVKQGICQTGVRNELVGLLNGTYAGINILEDAAATVESFLKNSILERMNAAIDKVTPDSAEAAQLGKAILTWMIHDDPIALLAIIDKNHELINELKQLFIENGSNPDALKVKDENDKLVFLSEFIPSFLNHIIFQRDIKQQPVLAFTDILLKANAQDIGQEVRNHALLSLQEWLKTTFNPFLKEHQARLAGFYRAYNASVQLQNYRIQLITTLSEQDFQENITILENYFKSIPALALTSELNTHIQNIEDMVKVIKKDPLLEPIENFFARWFIAKTINDDESISRLYSFLLDKNTQQKILLSETTLQAWNQSIEEDSSFVRYLTPYQINRIFLHAIITFPNPWDDVFAKTFQETLDFIKTLNTGTTIGYAISRTSYPDILIRQLEYIQQRQTQISHHRPGNMILLPNQIRTGEESCTCLEQLDDAQRPKIYKSHLVHFEPLLTQYSFDLTHSSQTMNFARVVKVIPYGGLAKFLNRINPEQFHKVIVKTSDFHDILSPLGSQRVAIVCTALKDLLPNNIADTASFINHVLVNLSMLQGNAVYNVWKDKIPNIIKTASDFGMLLSQIDIEHYALVFTKLQSQLHKIIITEEDLSSVLQPLNSQQKIEVCCNIITKIKDIPIFLQNPEINIQQRTELCTALQEKWPDLIKTVNDFYFVIQFLLPNERDIVFAALKDHWPKIVKTGAHYSAILMRLSIWNFFGRVLRKSDNSHRDELYTVFKNQWPDIIKTGRDAGFVLCKLDIKQRAQFCAALKDHWTNSICKTAIDVLKVLEYLDAELRIEVCAALKGQWFNIEFREAADVNRALFYLDTQQCFDVCTELKSQLPNIIKTAADFKHVLSNLSSEKRDVFCIALQESLICVVRSADYHQNKRELLGLLEDKTLFSQAEAQNKVIEKIASFISPQKPDNFLYALITNNPTLIKTELDSFFKNTGSFRFFSISSPAGRKQQVASLIGQLDSDWIKKIEIALNPDDQENALANYFASSIAITPKSSGFGF